MDVARVMVCLELAVERDLDMNADAMQVEGGGEAGVEGGGY